MASCTTSLPSANSAKYGAFAAVCGGHKVAHPCAEFETRSFTSGTNVPLKNITD